MQNVEYIDNEKIYQYIFDKFEFNEAVDVSIKLANSIVTQTIDNRLSILKTLDLIKHYGIIMYQP